MDDIEHSLSNRLDFFLKNLKIKSIIALDGDVQNKNFFEKFKNLPIFAADGAYHKLPILPKAIVGDLDSVNASEIAKTVELIQDADQNYGDFEKTVRYAESQQALPALVLGVNGGSLDHILNNTALLFNFAKNNQNFNKSILYTPPLAGQIIGPGFYSYDLPCDTKISIFGANANISTEGLKWELKNTELNFPFSSSTSNRIATTPLKLTVHQGWILIFIYLNNVKDGGSSI